MIKHRKNRRKWSAGQALVEYVVILAVFAVVLLASIPSFEDSVGTAYIASENKVTEDPDDPGPSPSLPPFPSLESYIVTYRANGGTNAPAMQVKEKDVDLELASEIPLYSGHEFLGWSTSLSRANSHVIDYSPSDMYTQNANLVLYASWTSPMQEYRLRYHLNAPEGSDAHFVDNVSPIVKIKKQDIPSPIISDVPVATGFTFLGWSEVSNATMPTWIDGNMFYDNRDADFYAIWVEAAYKVTYHANGGTGSVPPMEVYKPGATVTTGNANLTKPNYQFAGWSQNQTSVLVDTKVGSQFVMPSANVDLYAIYMPTEFPYNGTDGTDGSIQSFTAPVDGQYRIMLWGAKGGRSCNDGVVNTNRPNGGYTEVTVTLTRGQTIYFAVGGHGADNDFSRSTSAAAPNPGGWNGGGNGYTDGAVDEGGNFSSSTREGSGGGGGATAAYLENVGNGTLANYFNRLPSILAVAGGGAGANYTGTDGYGGGQQGGNSPYGATQSTGYEFGVGESATGARRVA